MNFLISAFKYPIGDAAIVAILGILIVFIVLAVLVGILTLFKLIFKIKLPSKHKESQQPEQPAEDVVAGEDEAEIVAAIAAALACMGEEEAAPAPFRIKSIRKLK